MLPDSPSIEDVEPYIASAIQTGRLVNGGPLSAELERLVREEAGTDHCVLVSSCTLGLELALTALHLPAGAPVLMPAFTFPATAAAVMRAGLAPVYADVEASTWALSPHSADGYVMALPKIVAVVPVCPLGASLHLRQWTDFEKRTGVKVVVDAAAALGNQEVPPGARVVFSMHATKPYSALEGGSVCSSDEGFVATVRALANFGLAPGSYRVFHKGGTNAKISEVHAAFGIAAMNKLAATGSSKRRRDAVTAAYLEGLGEGLQLQPMSLGDTRAAMAVLLQDGIDPTTISMQMAEAGVETRRWYWPSLNTHPALRAPALGTLQVTEAIGNRLIGLPFHAGMMSGQVAEVCRSLRDALAVVTI